MEFDFDTVVDRSGIGSMLEASKSAAIREAGLPTYWGAEFDFKTAPSVAEAIKAMADRGLLGFTLADDALLRRIAWWYETRRATPIRTEWVATTHGTIFSLATAIRCCTAEGDGVVMLTPGYMRYRQAADRLGRKTIFCPLVPAGGRYAIDFAALDAALARPKNRLLVLCNPNNPTGTIWNSGELAEVAAIAARRHATVFSDEIFAEVSFGGREVRPYFSIAGTSAQSITCGSLGKSFGLTGINCAMVVIPEAGLRERFLAQRNADHYGSIDPLHYAAIMGAYSEPGAAWLSAMKAYVWDNYLFVSNFFSRELPGVSVAEPEGTYVLWIDFRGLGLDGDELVRFLQDEALLCLDPGESYGGPAGFMRMNISVPRKELSASLARLLEASRKRGFCPAVDGGSSAKE
jgi:cystathionine beta-lyase